MAWEINVRFPRLANRIGHLGHHLNMLFHELEWDYTGTAPIHDEHKFEQNALRRLSDIPDTNMSAKDYNRIAQILRDAKQSWSVELKDVIADDSNGAINAIQERLSEYFKQENTNFKPHKFTEACQYRKT